MQKYIFFYTLNLSGDIWPLCGSDGISPIDGRFGLTRMCHEAEMRAMKLNKSLNKNIVAYSIGYLTTHDPNNKYATTIQKITKI